MASAPYKLHHSCKFVKGHLAYFIYDLYRTKGYYATLSVGDYLTGLTGSLPNHRQHKAELEELLKKEIIYTESNTAFKSIIPGGIQQSPDIISNLILRYSDDTYSVEEHIYNVTRLVKELRIKNVQVLIAGNYTADMLLHFINAFSASVINHFELVFTTARPSKSLLDKLCLNQRVQLIIIVKKQEQFLEKNSKVLKVSDRLYMKGGHPVKFSINKQLYEESQNYHSYFNKKMYIDEAGNLYNAQEYNKSFINIFKNYSTERIKKVIDSKTYRKYWNVRKDDTLVCKDCEFRHMCVDTRLPYKTKNGLWTHKESCNYNPYTATWKPLK